MTSDLAGMNQEVIIGHGRHPHNLRKLEHETRTARGVNPLCGNQFTVHPELTDGRITDIALQGSGGAIPQTSASLMTTVLTDKSEEEVLALFGEVHAMLTGGSDGEVDLARIGSLVALSRMSESPSGSSAPRSHGTHFEAPSTVTVPRGPGSSRG